MNDNRLLLAGAVPSALMALVADFGFGLIENIRSGHATDKSTPTARACLGRAADRRRSD